MIKKISDYIWEIPRTGKMLVPGKVFASDKLMGKIMKDRCLEQIQNVAQLPGIVGYSLGMPDAHFGYGFCVGGVAAFDAKDGIISPGGIGFDINCGVRLLTCSLNKKGFLKKRTQVINEIYQHVPSGAGRNGEFVLDDKKLEEVLEKGLDWAVAKGYAIKEDKECCEDNGRIKGAHAKDVSHRAKERGRSQLGTLGSGNHFLEIQYVEKIFACAPIRSDIGKAYLSAMAAAANFAFVNRQLITYEIRKVFGAHFPNAKLALMYDVAHNIAKFEKHIVDGKEKMVCVHRKGATRSFGPGEKDLPSRYRKTGQPIILPGSMGTFSYVLVGTKESEQLSFSSTAHGAGRALSRTYALEHIKPETVEKELRDYDVVLKAGSRKGMVEEAPAAYKDIDEVARVSHELGLGRLVARLKPLAVIKG